MFLKQHGKEKWHRGPAAGRRREIKHRLSDRLATLSSPHTLSPFFRFRGGGVGWKTVCRPFFVSRHRERTGWPADVGIWRVVVSRLGLDVKKVERKWKRRQGGSALYRSRMHFFLNQKDCDSIRDFFFWKCERNFPETGNFSVSAFHFQFYQKKQTWFHIHNRMKKFKILSKLQKNAKVCFLFFSWKKLFFCFELKL